MKKLITAILLFALSQFLPAQTISKTKVLVFSGSDWCKPCIQLKKNILDTKTFTDYSEQHLDLLIVDFPYKKKNQLPEEQQRRNDQLAEQYNPSGDFPKIILLDTNDHVLGQLGFQKNMSPQQLVSQIEEIITND